MSTPEKGKRASSPTNVPLAPKDHASRKNFAGLQAEERGTKRLRAIDNAPDYRPATSLVDDTTRLLSSAEDAVRYYFELEGLKRVLTEKANSDPTARPLLQAYFARACPQLEKTLFPEKGTPGKTAEVAKRKLPDGKKKTLKNAKEKLQFLLEITPEIQFKIEDFEKVEKEVREMWQEGRDEEATHRLKELERMVESQKPSEKERERVEST